MKNSIIELHQMNLTELDQMELTSIDGGKFWDWVRNIGVCIGSVALIVAGFATGGAAAVAFDIFLGGLGVGILGEIGSWFD